MFKYWMAYIINHISNRQVINSYKSQLGATSHMNKSFISC